MSEIPPIPKTGASVDRLVLEVAAPRDSGASSLGIDGVLCGCISRCTCSEAM